MTQLTITMRVDPQQIQNMPAYGLSHTKAQAVWTTAVTEEIKKAGFAVVVETGRGLDAWSDWHLTIGDHTIPSREGKLEGLDAQELARTLLGDCQCSGGPCRCHVQGHEVTAGLLRVLLHQADLAVKYALEEGMFAVEDAERGR